MIARGASLKEAETSFIIAALVGEIEALSHSGPQGRHGFPVLTAWVKSLGASGKSC